MSRFTELEAELAKRKGVKNPAALAAYIGKKKYGAKGMAKLRRDAVVKRLRG